jgi:hypothetical protein
MHSPSHTKLICWRRIDEFAGMEFLRLSAGGRRISVESNLICTEAGGFHLSHAWELTSDWRAQSLRIEKHDAHGTHALLLERDGAGWRVNGEPRPDLDGTEEPDLSVTPFCNTLIVRRVPMESSGSLTVDVAYIDGADLSVVRSRQRYDFKKPGLYRYIDLGVAKGFEADLQVDEEKLVIHYEHLFERVTS